MSVPSRKLSPVGGLSPMVAMLFVANMVLCNEAEYLPDVDEFESDGDAELPDHLRVINGMRVKPGEFPFLVAIDDRCAGAIIDLRHILTSADCVFGYSPKVPGQLVKPLGSMKVFISEHDRLEMDGERKVSIIGLRIHPGFDGSTKQHNIAILKTAKSMFWSTAGRGRVSAIGMHCGPVASNQRMSVVGWGTTSVTDHGGNPVPMRLDVRALSRDRCKCILNNAEVEFPDGSLCVQPYESGTICYGDEGAPLFLRNQQNEFELVGIASHFKSEPCREGKLPTVFTEVCEHIAWIHENQN